MVCTTNRWNVNDQRLFRCGSGQHGSKNRRLNQRRPIEKLNRTNHQRTGPWSIPPYVPKWYGHIITIIAHGPSTRVYQSLLVVHVRWDPPKELLVTNYYWTRLFCFFVSSFALSGTGVDECLLLALCPIVDWFPLRSVIAVSPSTRLLRNK
jgi:hypothetical protein